MMQESKKSVLVEPLPAVPVLSILYRALENVDVGVAAMDRQGKIIYANAIFPTLFPLPQGGSPEGHSLKEWFEERADFLIPLFESVRKGEMWQGETAFFTTQATWLNITALPENASDKESSGAAMLIIRNAERLRNEALLEQSRDQSRIMMESLGTICHAIGQPATVLLSSVEMMRMNIFDEKTQKEVLDLCYDAVLEMRDLLRQLNEKRQYATEAYLPNASDSILALDPVEKRPTPSTIVH
ncbi:MAG: hypothetical protein RSB74_07765 [Kiritimatiellia bacterium]